MLTVTTEYVSSGRVQVHRKSVFCIGYLALAGLVCIGVPTSAAARSQSKPVAHAKAASKASKAPKRTLYSAQRSLSRKAILARARAIATSREMADTVLPRYKIDAGGELVPDLRAAAAIIYNPETNQVLWEENSQAPRSIASITKVMTATVFLENNPDLTQPITIDHSDVFQASTTHVRANDRLSTDDVLHLMLIASDNAAFNYGARQEIAAAARALARVSPQGSAGFIVRMNEKAAELGLESTIYADPSGLLSENVSSAYDMARLITHASGDERIASVMRTPEYTVRTAKNRVITFHSTDRLLGRENVDVRAAKTGFISKAGYCLATLLRLPQGVGGQSVAVVVLGARSNAGRFMETQNLFNWLSTRAATIFTPKPQQIPQH